MITSLILAVGFGQAKPIPTAQSKELPTSTRPYVEIGKLKNLKCVTVSEYRLQDEGTKAWTTTRVYRFTYRGTLTAVTTGWEKDFPKTDGWYVDSKPNEALILTRPIKHPKTFEQSLLFHSGTIIFDPKVRARTRAVADKDWVWISLNEQVGVKKP